MIPTESLLLSWGAIHIVMGISTAYLAKTVGPARDYRRYTYICMSIATYCISGAWLMSADSPHEAHIAQQLQLIGAWITIGQFVFFAHDMTGMKVSQIPRIILGVTISGIILVLGHVYFDRSYIVSGKPLLPLPSPQYQVATLPWMMLDRVPVAIIISITLYRLFTQTKGLSRIGAHILVAGGACAWIIDTTERVFALPTCFIAEHIGAVSSIFLGYGITRRFIDTDHELEQKNRELQHAYHKLHAVQHQLIRNEQLAAVGELSTVIAHEVQLPLSKLKNAIIGLRKTTLYEEERSDFLNLFDQETNRLNRLVYDLLAFSRPLTLQIEQIEIKDLIESTTNSILFRHKISSKIDLIMQLDQIPLCWSGDRILLEYVFYNIIENAIEAMPDGGQIHITGSIEIKESIPYVQLMIADSGEGMDTLIRSRAREPFFTTRSTGTGLGLAIVERMIKAHSGFIQLSGHKDYGTIVTIGLPLERISQPSVAN